MVKILILVLALSSPAYATEKETFQNPPREKWTGEDKEWHFMAGAVISTASTVKWESRAVGFGAACGTGIAFELLAPGVKSYKDAVVTCLGAAFGALIGGWHVQGQRNGVIVRREF